MIREAEAMMKSPAFQAKMKKLQGNPKFQQSIDK